MAGQMIFFTKSLCDFENPNVSVTASESQDVADKILNRSNTSAFVTSGSNDAALTTLIINFGDVVRITDILLLIDNFKAYTIQYYNDDTSLYTNFSTPISETVNTAVNKRHSFTAVYTSRVKLIIQGTMVADADKYLAQFIATNLIGQLDGWPVFKTPRIGRTLKANTMLSGKVSMQQSAGYYATKISVANWKSDADLTIVESIFNANEGFLFWPCGGDESQFSSARQGYRLEDIYLCRCVNDYSPEWVKGLYQSGLKIDIDLREVVT